MTTQFNSNEDVYTFVKKLINIAIEIKDIESANLLTSAFDSGGVTASEQLGEIRIALSSINTHDMEYPNEVVELISAAIRAIDSSFKRANSPF